MSDAYPKIMTRAGVEISVGGAAEEAEKRADGWCSPLDVAEAPAPVLDVPSDDPGSPSDDEPEGPTFGPPHDQTHEKRKAPTHKKK